MPRVGGFPATQEFISALQLMQTDAESKTAFEHIHQRVSASGWSIAKLLGKHPNQVSDVLELLKKHRIVNSEGSGLEGYYYLTNLGLELYKYVASQP